MNAVHVVVGRSTNVVMVEILDINQITANFFKLIRVEIAISTWFRQCFFHNRALTAAILDRITHHALISNMNGESFRRSNET
jgi:hypothetical protein